MSAFTFGARLLAAATLAFAFVAAGVPAVAQTTGQIKGKVVDGKGQPVDKAAVTIEFKGGTNLKREVKTNKKGEFIQVGLQPGPYYVTVQHEGRGRRPRSGPGGPRRHAGNEPDAEAGDNGHVARGNRLPQDVRRGRAGHGRQEPRRRASPSSTRRSSMRADCYACYMNVGSLHYEKKEIDKAEAAFKKAARTEAGRPAPGPDAGRSVQRHGHAARKRRRWPPRPPPWARPAAAAPPRTATTRA